MHSASSAFRTKGILVSASEWTATVLIPNRLHVRRTRTAISPRFAISTLENMEYLRFDAGLHTPPLRGRQGRSERTLTFYPWGGGLGGAGGAPSWREGGHTGVCGGLFLPVGFGL